jgi:predicted acyltransferase
MGASSKSTRLQSLDALRGFDMFWITGGEDLFHALAKVTAWGWATVMAEELTHVDWNGFRFYDLIFPLFLFLAGVSTPYSLGAKLENGADKTKLLRKIIQRGLVLVLLGIVYNNGLQIKPLADIRFASVLGRIGLAGMFAQIIYLYSTTKTQYFWFASLLVGYWVLLMFVPVPGCGAGALTMECNWTSYVDRLLLPGRLHKTIHDPEGILSTIPAIGTALMGVFAGNLLKSDALPMLKKVAYLFVAAIICLILGKIWNVVFPINKNLWTSSFVLYAGGWSLVLLAVFYWIIDVKGWQRWAFVFTIIGVNSILIYLAQHFIDFAYTTNAVFGGLLQLFPEPTHEVLSVVAFITIEWCFLYFLYKKKVFLKV